MDYSTDLTKIVFLKDTDIVQNMAGTNSNEDAVLSNGVASFDFAVGISSTANSAITAVNERCDTIENDLATGLYSVNDLISNLTSGLNIKLESETTARSNLTLFLSTKISNDISVAIDDLNTNLATSASNLTTAVEAIRADVKGGVNYKGHLKLNAFSEPYDLSTYIALLHGARYENDDIIIPDNVISMELNNGWMYYVSLPEDISSYTTHDDITFVPGNYVIVHAHNENGDTDVDLSSVALSSIKRENIDIIKVTDSDLVRTNLLVETSGNLTTLIDSTKIELNGNIDSAKEWVENTVSNSLSTDYVSKIGAVATDLAEAEQKYDAICVGLSTNLRDLSTDVTGDISSEVHNKVTLSAFGNSTISAIENLKLVKMTAALYAAVDAADKEAGDKIYCITDADINAYGNKVVSVAVPTASLDAANKQYVDAASAFVDGEVQLLRNDVVSTCVVSADAKAAILSVQGNTYLNDVSCNNLSINNISLNMLCANDGKFNLNLSANAISTSGLKIENGSFALSTGNTAINILTQNGLADVRINSTSLKDTLTALSNECIVSAKTYSNALSNALSTTTGVLIATALFDAKNYTNDLSVAIDAKFSATSTYINTQDTAASAYAYATSAYAYEKVKTDLTSELDSSNHLKLYIGDKVFADYKLHNVLQSAALSDVGGQKAIVFTWNTAAGVENTTSVLVQDLIDIYNAEGPYIKLSSDSTTFYLDFNALSNALGVGSLSTRATALEVKTTTNETNINALQASATAFNVNITALQTSANTISTNLGYAVETITGLSTALTAPTSGINAKIDAINGSLTSISAIYATQASLSAYATTADYETAAVAEGKYVLTGAAWSAVSSNAEGLVNSKLTAYYTKNAADGKFVADDDLSNYYTKSEMTAYYNATSADSTFATKTAVNSGIVAKLSAITETAVEKFAEPSNVVDISAVADKLNKLIDVVDDIRNKLRSLTSIS